jgi:hypothetical protein
MTFQGRCKTISGDYTNTIMIIRLHWYRRNKIRFRNITYSNRPHISHTRTVGSIPTVARHIFQACPVWIYTQSNITRISGEVRTSPHLSYPQNPVMLYSIALSQYNLSEYKWVCANHPYLQLRAKLDYEGRSSTWSSQRLSKGAYGSHPMTHVWSRSTATVEGSVRQGVSQK